MSSPDYPKYVLTGLSKIFPHGIELPYSPVGALVHRALLRKTRLALCHKPLAERLPVLDVDGFQLVVHRGSPQWKIGQPTVENRAAK